MYRVCGRVGYTITHLGPLSRIPRPQSLLLIGCTRCAVCRPPRPLPPPPDLLQQPVNIISSLLNKILIHGTPQVDSSYKYSGPFAETAKYATTSAPGGMVVLSASAFARCGWHVLQGLLGCMCGAACNCLHQHPRVPECSMAQG